MNLLIGEFEVEIKAKGVTDANRYNKEDLSLFLSELFLAYEDSSLFHHMQGREPVSRELHEKASQILEANKSLS